MKKFGKSLMAIVIAVASAAYSTGAKTDDFDCTGQLIWYEVKPGFGDDITVTVGSPIDEVDLSYLYQDRIPDVSPLGIITSADFAAHWMTQATAQSAYCPTPGSNVCAIGFKPDSTPAGEYKFVIINGVNYIVPRTTSDPPGRPPVECIIYRPTP